MGIAAAIIMGVTAAVTTGAGLYAGHKEKEAAKAADKKAYGLAMMERDDTLAANRESLGLSRKQLQEGRRQYDLSLGFQKSQARKDRAERQENRTYSRFRDQANQFFSLMNRDKELQKMVGQRFSRRRR